MVTRTGEVYAPATSFVGRQAELVEVEELLRRFRLVTLTGVGGVGKTRLALRVASRLRSKFPDGVWPVRLSPIQESELLGHTIAETLGVVDQVLRPQAEVLADFLASRKLLLILDTCEHLIDECAVLVEGLLRAAPELRILATSRQPLDVPVEELLALEPLPPADAVELFMDRAVAVVPEFLPVDKDHEVTVTLCRRLDGLPLAIELAAVQLGSMSVSQMLARLGDRFELLGDADHAEPRHQALRSTIGWSHELCAPLERLLWARVSVFAGDFDLEAAERICSDRQLPQALVSTILLELVDKSIVVRTDSTAGVRYLLLDVVRAYGAEWLRELGEEWIVRRRHRDYYVAMARRGDAEWLGPDQVAWRERAVLEHNNFRAALDFCLAAPEGHLALELAAALWFFWYPCGFQRDGRHYLRRALAQDTAPSPARTNALLAQCMVAHSQGDYAESLLTECAEAAAGQAGDLDAQAKVHVLSAGAAFIRGDLARVVAEARRAVELERRRDEHGSALLHGLGVWALALVAQDEIERAVALLEEMRTQCERRGELWMRSTGDYVRARAELARGRVETAESYARAALAVKRRLHDRTGMSTAIDLLAGAAAAAGDGHRAARLLGFGHQVWRTFGLPQLGAPEFVAGRDLCERRARAAIGDEAYEAAFRTGLEGEVDDGIAYALGLGA
ncbi:MAG TPA: NB-ARC domain-containing protein [Streptosporangiaceae bacterium]|nr:NB-ARC domain-containing protein [Streptosporangiaceae bacterium]